MTECPICKGDGQGRALSPLAAALDRLLHEQTNEVGAA